ncbi:unnamed protein product [Cyprideis torosa]|uniref:Carbamoyl-phosphate synthase (glutamine-hydrolyzing) n=1 Tax=Cyprideis torosa TaxID=163714 RepID=A0A7R8WEQ8_9CRUS|nr:unnamed protein product [Cyprideis torosa]CAG0895908.1 unnamed protein product [Cyprideis torosa]
MKVQDIKKVLVIGSGALKIGEAGEFDYSGAQALKALREEGIASVLINPNIATVQTSEAIADQIYFLPITPYFVEQVIKKEKPDGVFLAFGGQTALNCGAQLYEAGIFEEYNIKVLGTPVQSILDSEDRDIFKRRMDQIEIKLARSGAATNFEEAKAVVAEIGYPVIVIIDESLKGWKEVEYEVVRDQYGNCITVCNMENFDPIGVHTGESIVVAPSQTLTNSEYHKLRELSRRIAGHMGIIGECNVQLALDPESEDYRVIEINARLSRSSALASKATGYPLAFVAAKLALGYGLHEVKNSITKTTPAFFEPALDYVVVKLPRWDLNKFTNVSRKIGSAMKSVGEVMAIGVSFEEALQKGIRMLDNGLNGFINPYRNTREKDIETALNEPTDQRILVLEEAFRKGYTVDQIYDLTKIDKWFLYKLEHIHQISEALQMKKDVRELDTEEMMEAKKAGFSDYQIGGLFLQKINPHEAELTIRNRRKVLGVIPYVRQIDTLAAENRRKVLGVIPYVRQIDTLAAEYPAQTNYLYLTYHADHHDIDYHNTKETVVVLGSGVYRIGSSVEFDWCGVNALLTLREKGYDSVMINYNPETVSTDYDMCDRLYFDELTFERVTDIIELENPKGTIVSMGGQIPNNMAMKLHKFGVKILGTSPESIDMAENRHRFSAMLDELGLDQPRWKELSSLNAIYDFADEVGFPLLIRPSYVLSGAAMNVVGNKEEMEVLLSQAQDVSPEHPVVVSEFIQGAKEIEMDAVAQNGTIVDYAISEHVEFAGVHSGDATIMFPPQNVYVSTLRKIRNISAAIAEKWNISGPFNIQFLAKNNDIKVIELNLRASRSFPFVSKVMKNNLITKATEVLLGDQLEVVDGQFWDLNYVGVKASQFSFQRLKGADPVLGVDMSSTGEVGCIGEDAEEALLKAMLSVGMKIPKKSVLFSSGPIESKTDLLESARKLKDHGFDIYASKGTHKFFKENGVDSTHLYWHDEDQKPNVADYLSEKKLDLVINIPKNLTKKELNRGYYIRRNAVDFNISLLTNARLAKAFINAILKYQPEDLTIKAWGEYH